MNSTTRPVAIPIPKNLTPTGAAIIAAALSLCMSSIVLVNYLRSPYSGFLLWDAARYWQWALDIVRGPWLGTDLFHQAPLYPYLLAVFITVFGEHLVPVYLFQCMLSAATSALICFSTVRICGNTRSGLIAGCLFALYGLQVFYTVKILSECLAAFLIVLVVRFLVAKKPAILPAGISTGLLLLAKPYFLPAVPLLAAWYIFRPDPSDLQHRVRQAGLFLLPVAIILLSVTARNHLIGHEWVLVSSNGGENFYVGNNDRATGTYNPIPGISSDIAYQSADIVSKAAEETGTSVTRAGASKYWFRKGIAFITSHPAAWITLEFTKLLNIFSGADHSNMYQLRFERKNLTPAMRVPFIGMYALIPLFFIGLVAPWRRWRGWYPVLVLLGMNLFNMLLFFYDTRFMVITMPLFIMLCGAGAEELTRWVRGGSVKKMLLQPRAILFLCGIGVTVVMMQRDRRIPDQDWRMWLSLGDIHYDLGQLDESIDDYIRASELNKHNCMPAFGVCKALYKRGNREEAARLYQSTFPTINADDRTTVLRDPELDGLREFLGNGSAQTSR